MLSLIIPGSKSPGDKLHVYLKPLLEDLKDLFVNGMPTYDASRNETYQIYVKDLFVLFHRRMGMLTMWRMMICSQITNTLVMYRRYAH